MYDEIERAGAKVRRDIRPEFNSREVMQLFGQMRYAAVSDGQSAEVFNENKKRLAALGDEDDGFLARSLRGFTMSHYQWLRFNQRREELRREWDKVFAEVDIVLCPPATTVAFPHDQNGERHERMVEVNGELVPGTDETFWAGISGLFHLPATVAPAGFGHSGLPVGVQIVGQRHMDFRCIRFAGLLEQQVTGFVAPDDMALPD